MTSKSRFKFLTTSYIDTIKTDHFPDIYNGYVNYYVITNSTSVIGYESGDNLRGSQITLNYDGNIKRRYKDNGAWTDWEDIVLKNKIQRGAALITPTTANTPEKYTLVFPTAFSSVPTVVVTPNVGIANVTATVTDVTKNGCNIWLTRPNTTATTVHWLATSV